MQEYVIPRGLERGTVTWKSLNDSESLGNYSQNKYRYNGTLYSHKKEWSSHKCDNMDEPWKHYAKWNKPDIKGQILYDSTYIRYLE